jgi:membrane protease YdiL (CAAX protease family)
VVEGLINTVIQVGVVLIVCLVAWLIFGRRKASFRNWVGLTGAPPLLLLLCLAIGAAGAWLLLQASGVAALASGPGTVIAASMPDGVTVGAIVVLVASAVFKTAFAEELLFRGLIGKRLYGAMGFWPGNLVQALLFGAVHLPLLLLPDAPRQTVLLMIGFATVMAVVSGWLNERRAGGSILPGFALHGAGNLTTYLGLALAWI